MLIYNVTNKVDPAIAQEWLDWMKTSHVPDVMRTGLFSNYRICRLDQVEEDAEPTFVIQYHCESREKLALYLEQHAPALREEVIAKYGNRFVAFRTIMEVVQGA